MGLLNKVLDLDWYGDGSKIMPFRSPMSGSAGGDPTSMVKTEHWMAMNIYGPIILGAAAGTALSSTRGLRYMDDIKDVKLVLSWIRSPFLMYLKVQRNSVVAAITLKIGSGWRIAGYISFAANPLITFHYISEGQYTEAAIGFYGPFGSVYMYHWVLEKQEEEAQRLKYLLQPESSEAYRPRTPPPPTRQKYLKSQRGRSKNWCPRHKRYDYCR